MLSIRDLPRKIAFAFFILSIVLLVAYQFSFILNTTNIQYMLEPDSYIYLIFAQQALQHGIFNSTITNPYIITKFMTFPEATGLYQLPAILHLAIPQIPLAWDFRILYGLAIFVVYIFTYLITKRIMDNIPVNQTYRYIAYTLVFLSYLLMQQTEIIEWRGGEFIVAFAIMIVWLICSTVLNKEASGRKRIVAFAGCVILLCASYYMWHGWEFTLIPFLIIPVVLIYDRLNSIPRFYWVLSLAVFFVALVVLIIPIQIQHITISILDKFIDGLVPGNRTLDCFNNPLTLAEVQCLNANNGLYAVLLDIIFMALAIRGFLFDRIFSLHKSKYEYFIVAVITFSLLGLPFALIYVRLVQIIAPYLTIAFAVGVVTLLARMGASRWVMSLVLTMIVIASLFSFLVFWQTTSILYTISNPPGLQNVVNWLGGYPNSTVFTFYTYGDYLEYSAHVKVYSDTVQGLNTTIISEQDNFYTNSSCELQFSPTFVITSNTFGTYNLFVNASNSSFAKNPLGVENCGWALVYSSNGFYVWKV